MTDSIPITNRINLIRRLTGILSGHQMIQCHSQTINVGSLVCLSLSSELLRAAYPFCSKADDGILQIVFYILLQSQNQSALYFPFWLQQHDICRFHVSIYNWRFCIYVSNPILCTILLPTQVQFPVAEHHLSLQHLIQWFAFYIVHYNIDNILFYL